MMASCPLSEGKQLNSSRPEIDESPSTAVPPTVTPERLPTFVIGGVRKAATTALWHLLDDHPDVGMGVIKEPQFFSRDAGRAETGDEFGPPRTGTFERGWDWYAQQFDHVQSAAQRGEASTMYFDSTDSAHLLRTYLPSVRLIFCLRHPVDRVYSHYWFERQSEYLPDFDEMVHTRHRRLEWYVHQSHYRVHLDRFASHFPPEQIHLVLDSDLADAPGSTLADVHRYLELEPLPVSVDAPRRRNVASASRSVGLNRLLTQHRGEWTRYVPSRLTPVFRKTKEWVLRQNAQPFDYPPMNSDVRAVLVDEFSEDVDAVERMLDRDLSAWRV